MARNRRILLLTLVGLGVLGVLAGIFLVASFFFWSWWRAQQGPLPMIAVSVSYPGASDRMVAETVAQPIEQQINGVEGMVSMVSSCSEGSYTLIITFQRGFDLDMAQVLVQNRVNLALPVLPAEVQKNEIRVEKKTSALALPCESVLV